MIVTNDTWYSILIKNIVLLEALNSWMNGDSPSKYHLQDSCTLPNCTPTCPK